MFTNGLKFFNRYLFISWEIIILPTDAWNLKSTLNYLSHENDKLDHPS